ncbi:tumor susceptibility protein [Anaeramoeba flamelloides]|uniref:Tumor susceptibility protein n=1 Tax=Anaeramoeba flamelloides TaxID=1746091 RepID=A0ABQ8XDT6_9EUKA|nr:tumor susceptibility protein [Anaeramoeba flamelloides]
MTQQFPQTSFNVLDQLLKQVNYKQPFIVRKHCYSLLMKYKTLQPRLGFLPPLNKQKCLFFYGTIPIYYKKKPYNIPISFYILPFYPNVPPLCYVAPSQSMMITPNHRHVDKKGEIYLTYLSDWKLSMSNLVGLVDSMCMVFSQNPPLRSKPRKQQLQQLQQQQHLLKQQQLQKQQTSMNQSSQQRRMMMGKMMTMNQGMGNNMSGNNMYLQNQYQLQNKMNSSQSQPTFEDTLRNQLTAKLQQRFLKYNEETPIKLKKIINQQAELTTKNNEVNNNFKYAKTEIQRIQKETKKNEEQINALTEKIQRLEIENQEMNSNSLDIDKLTESPDVWFEQIQSLEAKNCVYADLMYHINQLLHKGLIDTKTYLQNIRNLSAEQYQVKQHSYKIQQRLKLEGDF